MAQLKLILSSLLYIAALQGLQAVQFSVTNNAGNTPGGIRFTNEIGVAYTKQTMQSASAFVWKTFKQTNAADRKNWQSVSLVVVDMNRVGIYGENNELTVSARYIGGYPGDVKTDFTGKLYYQMTRSWMWTGNGEAVPAGLSEGIAYYVRLKAGYAESDWVKPGGGEQWDQGNDVTARFLDYCNSLRGDFVAQLNAKMKTGYSNSFFADLLGKTVDQLWSDYKAKYAT